MAKKGQKFNKYSDEFKYKIINEYLDGQNGGSRVLSKKYNISYKTINTWIYKYKRQGNLENDINHTRGRKKEENIDYKERYEILKKYQAFLKAQRERK
ncbi:MAG: helix-turn-helix domain-containing protein [Bacilli bacterium]|nr:helix-turn-helix domain-containing protein [Bacilli bacterium]